jgi:hypothetical protein
MQAILGAAGTLATSRGLAQGQTPPSPGGPTIEWSGLQDKVKGRVISRRDPDYERAKQSFAPPNRQRPQQLKEKYDPNDVFFSYLGPG